MKRLLTFLGAMFIMAGSMAWAQEVNSSATAYGSSSGEDGIGADGADWIPSISLDSRFSYNRIVSGDSAGLGGDGFWLNIDGKIGKHFSYSLSQRLDMAHGEDPSVFENTDWLNLTYEVDGFSFTAGKDVLMVGSFEYDAYDIDSYFDMNSMFYNSFACYQWGVKTMWTNPSETSSFAFQVTNSPFAFAPREENMHAYNLGWYGAWDSYESIWTFNMLEYAPGSFVKMLSLGNMFYIGDFSLMVDYIMRGDKVKNMFDDVTLNIMPSVNLGESVRLFAKFGWERMGSELPYDIWGEYLSVEDQMAANDENTAVLPAYIVPSEDYIFYGAGVEYFPLKENKSIRLHAAWTSNNYTKRHALNIGLTWKFDLVNAVEHITRRVK